MGVLLLSASLTFAANPSTSEIKNMSTRLNNHKNTLIKNIENSKIKLEKQAKEAKKFSNTSLFRAASCLKAIPEGDQNLDFSKLTTDLKTAILNEYIKLDGDIKRYEFWLNTADPIIFSNNLENFYNQNAIKITNLENNYYLKVDKTKKAFLEYVDNNKDLLNGLAQKLETISQIDEKTHKAQEAFSGFMKSVNTTSQLREKMINTNKQSFINFGSDIDQIMAEIINQHHIDAALQAKFLIHKENFINKFKSESNKAVFSIFSAAFDYPKYLQLLEKKDELHKKFDDTNGKLNCSILLTTTTSFTPYTNNLESDTKALINGLENITKLIKNGKIDLKELETPAFSTFSSTINKLGTELRRDFRLMLEHEIPAKTPAPTPNNEKAESPTQIPSTPQANEHPQVQAPQTPIAKTTFTQAFKKGQYHSQILTLQTYLKNIGLYQGAINGVYSPATIQAVYQFQLKHGVVTGKEKNKAGYGRLGPKTRAALNNLL